MWIYIFVNIFIILLALLVLGLVKKTVLHKNNDKKININETIFTITTFVLLVFISGFRGDFTQDYNSYLTNFNLINSFSFKEILTMNFHTEIGYTILNWIIGLFTKDGIYLFVITTLIILILFYKNLIKDSSYLWLSILLFVNIGVYYTSFNITRQIIAVAIIFAGSTYLYQKKFYKYLVVVLLASLFHKTSLIMIPFYFLLTRRFKIKTFVFSFLALAFTTYKMNDLLEIIQRFFYSGYTFGMTGGNIGGVMVPISIIFYVTLHWKLIDFRVAKYNIWVNAVVFYVFFSVLSLKVQMLGRFADFFSPYILLIIPYILSNIKNKHLRTIHFFLITILLVAFNYVVLSGTGYDPYYFIWQR